MKKIVITGGAGYIGSHIVEKFAADYPGASITVLDKMTYAAHIENILPLITAGRVDLIVGDICDIDACARAVKDADLVIHAAAESHVDNSFSSSLVFTHTNVYGTHCVMEACRQAGTPRIIHVSTDEVYGQVLSGAVDEQAPMNPTNPYSASKAAAEMVINGYKQSYRLPVIIIRPVPGKNNPEIHPCPHDGAHFDHSRIGEESPPLPLRPRSGVGAGFAGGKGGNRRLLQYRHDRGIYKPANGGHDLRPVRPQTRRPYDPCRRPPVQ
ncbi:MAG: GDP-mannose 4,6-dehydratase [Micavibrio aeruginosavorus]|nr:GDP-mannose 4,6-dehydratase [Micavibrio aeruginosavorus]